MKALAEFYKHIIKNENDTFSIIKDNERYGTYDDITDALHDRDLFVEYDWDMGEVMAQDEKPNIYKTMELPAWDRYITKQHNGYKTYYKVQKTINGEQKCFGYFKTYQEAVDKRDEMEKCGWVKDVN